MANSSPTYPNEARTMTEPVSIASSVRVALDDGRGQCDQQTPRDECVDVKDRDSQYPVIDIEQVQQRIVEQQAAEQEHRDQALALYARSFHDGGSGVPQTSRIRRWALSIAAESPGSRAWKHPA